MQSSANVVKIKNMAITALFSAVMAVCAWIHIPFFYIAFTLQVFAVFLALFVLGPKHGSLAVLVYILLGAVGLPVFAGFTGGVGVLFGITGGYIMGFLGSCICYFVLTKLFKPKNMLIQCLFAFISLLVCYAFGTLWFVKVAISQGKSVTVWAALLTCVVPYILPDILKIIFAAWVAEKTAKKVKFIH